MQPSIIRHLTAIALIGLIASPNVANAQSALALPAAASIQEQCTGFNCPSGTQSRPLPPWGGANPNVPEDKGVIVVPREGSRSQPDQFPQQPQFPGQYPGQFPAAVPPEPPPLPTEFQNFVADSLGHALSIYGQSLFDHVPTTFAPIDRVPVTADYVIGPGDELMLKAWGQIDVDARLVVDRSGQVTLPKVGTLSVAGLKYEQLPDYFRTAIGRVFRNFDLSVNMGQLRSIQIFVVGQARRPGSYTVSSLSTLVNALFASGGPSSSGSMRHIQLKRGNEVVTEFDFYDLLLNGDKSKDVRLLPGDVIYIPPVGPSVAVAGSVNVPAIYELRGEESLQEAIDMASGLTTTADEQKVVIERIEARTTRKVEEFPIDDRGLRRELQDGDLVRVLSLSPRFENAVTLRGNVARPGRYEWHSGMRMKDLIPNQEALITRDYWRQSNSLSTDTDDRDLPRTLVTQEKSARDYQGQDSPPPTGPRDYPWQNTSLATGARDCQWQNSSLAAGAGVRGMRRDPAALATAGKEAGEAATNAFHNDVKRNAPEINWDYAVIQRLNPVDLSSQLIPFNLGKLVLHSDDSNNLVLEPGDIVTIFSQNDMTVPQERQSKYVRLEGEFRAPGVYKVRPGETLRTLIERAGGLSSGAYIFGTEFMRESARIEQQKSLDEMTHELELEVDRLTLANAQKKPEEQEALKTVSASQHAMVEKFRQIRATGRIVLEMGPAAPGVQAFPAIKLEDGDRVYVPHKPSTVSVVGSVYNQNSFLFRPSLRPADYVKLAGNGTRDADLKHMFIVRADGSVVSKQSLGGMWRGGSLATLRMLPGDTVVVPAQLERGTFMRGLKDWTQVLSQMATGVAVVNLLK